MVKRHFQKIDEESSALRPGARPSLKIYRFLRKRSKVQQKWVKGFKNINYTKATKPDHESTMEKRRKRWDLIETYKIITGKEDVESASLFTVADNVYDLQGHQLRSNYGYTNSYLDWICKRTFLLSELLRLEFFLRRGGALRQCFQKQTGWFPSRHGLKL